VNSPHSQRWLDFGPADHFRLLHGGHSENVAVCSLARGAPRSAWQNKVFAHDDAGAVIVGLVGNSDLNLYQSQNGFRVPRRTSDSVAAFTSVFVDLDHYKIPELAGLDAEALLDRILAAHPWLPVPTMLFNSGRGVYLSWLFTRPLNRDYLARWQSVENIVVGLLEPFGADQLARDAARVLRVVGSINQKSGEAVTGVRDTGHSIVFEQLERAVLRHGLAPARKTAHERTTESGLVLVSTSDVERAVDDSARSTAAQRAQYLRPLQLASDRMADCRTIATLRGLPLTDYRARLLFVYATAATWYTTDDDQLAAELDGFASELFADGDRYGRGQVGTVIDKMRHDRDGIIRVWHGQRIPFRYRLGNPYIIRLLNLSAAEQRELRTIIDREERQRRRTERRRASGMEVRGDYLARAADRHQRAVELRAQGWTQRAIAAELGVTQGRVSQILSGKDY